MKNFKLAVRELIAERDRLNEAIDVLQKIGTTDIYTLPHETRTVQKRTRKAMTAATRKKLSQAKKAYWAKRKSKA